VLQGDTEKVIPAEQVRVGDRLRVLPGETIPVDGVILSGQTSINQAVMTGESLPVDKTVGDEVSSGTMNQFGAFEMKATKVGKDSSIQRMIQLVQSADAGKTKIVGIADRWATWIVVIALSAATFTGIISGELIRAVTILVVFCPCALVLATPTAIMAAIGNATKHGFLVRTSIGKSSSKLLQRVLSETFEMLPGRGVSAVINGKMLLAGNEKLMQESGVEEIALMTMCAEAKEYLQQGCTIIYIAVDQKAAGYIALSDTIREESTAMIDQLTALGVQPVLLTGDHENAAKSIADQLHISEVHAGCLPEDKLNWIADYQKKEEAVCMIGDGVNDAPALKRADVGIAMGGVGSDIAVDAADIALVHNAGSVLVIINSALLLNWKRK